ncbi:MAG TPA: hypothetical protein VIK88_00610 [Candidatus Bathyarchaeia archaeon]
MKAKVKAMSIPRVEQAYDKHTWIIISEGLTAPASGALAKGEAVEFMVKREPWVRYKLADGTRLFGRVVVTKVVRTREYEPTGEPVYAWFNQAIFTSIAPETMRGKPSDPQPTSLNPEDCNVVPLEFERLGPEEWNEYELSDGTIMKVTLKVTGIHRTDRYANDGDPFYIVGSEPVQRLEVPKRLLRK